MHAAGINPVRAVCYLTIYLTIFGALLHTCVGGCPVGPSCCSTEEAVLDFLNFAQDQFSQCE